MGSWKIWSLSLLIQPTRLRLKSTCEIMRRQQNRQTELNQYRTVFVTCETISTRSNWFWLAPCMYWAIYQYDIQALNMYNINYCAIYWRRHGWSKGRLKNATDKRSLLYIEKCLIAKEQTLEKLLAKPINK